MIRIRIFLFLITVLLTPAFLMPLPDFYGENECELIAKDLMRAHSNANLVFIMPLKDNGAYDTGAYSGHFINSVSIHGKIYYIDYKSHSIMQSREEVLEWYHMWYGKNQYSKAEMWDLRTESPPFGIIWHYP